MSDVQLKSTCTYLQEPSPDCQTHVEIEMYFEHRAEYPDGDPRAWRILTAPICLCKGRHKVFWTLKGAPVLFSKFELVGETPPKVMPNWPPTLDKETGKWTTFIDNTGVNEANGFHYKFWFEPANRSGKPLCSHNYMGYDPTIAVTPDPIEIPPELRYPLATSGREESLERGLGA